MDLRVLGPIELRGRDGCAVPLGGPVRRALLARLVVERSGVVVTDRLIEDLWHGAPPATARTALRVNIASLRRALTAAGDASGQEVLVRRAAGYALDVAKDAVDAYRFEAEVDCVLAKGDRMHPASVVPRLRHALGEWRGPAYGDLIGWDFAQMEADRLAELRLLALEHWAMSELLLGRHAEIAGELGPVLLENPLRERLCGLTMLALYRAGRQAEALRCYAGCRRHLRDELGLLPHGDLTSLEEGILRHDPQLEWQPGPQDAVHRLIPGREVNRTGRPSRLVVRRSAQDDGRCSNLEWTEVLADVPLVGRAAELQQVLDARATSAARRRSVLLRGPAGIGKSRLAAEAARMADDAGDLVLFGRCHPGATMPYQPVVEALQHFARACGPDQFPQVTGFADSEIAWWLPEVEPAEPLRPPHHRDLHGYCTFEVTDRLLEALARRWGVFFVLEDLQHADRGTLLLYQHLTRSPKGGTTLLGTQGDALPGDGAAGVTPELREQLVHDLTIVLKELSADEVDQLVARAVGVAPEGVAEILRDATGGIPLFLNALLRERTCQADVLGLAEQLSAPGRLEVAPEISSVVCHQLGRLTTEVREVLVLAAAIGRRFEVSTLAEVAGAEEEQLLGHLERAVESAVVREIDVDAYEFQHELHRHVLHRGLTRSRRQRIGRRVALAAAGRRPRADERTIDLDEATAARDQEASREQA